MTKVASIGECMLELSAADSQRDLRRLGFGGDTLNTAVYLARLGVSVDYVTALGDDPYSERMIEDWRKEGVGTDWVQRIAGRLPGLYTIELDDKGERRFFYWRQQAPAREIFANERTNDLCNALMDYDWLYLSGISLSLYGEAGRERLFELVRQFRAKGGKVAFDSNYRPRGWPSVEVARREIRDQLALTDLVLSSLEDETGLNNIRNAEEAGDFIHDLGPRTVVIKQGKDGCMVSVDGTKTDVPAIKDGKVVDATAAGDSFNAGFLAATLRGEDPVQAANLGHRCASVVIAHHGAIVPRDAFQAALGGSAV
ncbi:sugar kinase [Dongia deserti]|uniref:sugar kinase n=1 Tax=Dongia deserti TaxID=2268030 RepID=UPI000E6460BA|nr:sugar kinase [Dongia deserti]